MEKDTSLPNNSMQDNRANGNCRHPEQHGYSNGFTMGYTQGIVSSQGAISPPLHAKASPELRKLANPAPLGLCAFALTTFVLSCINMHARDQTQSNIVVPLAFAYGGLVQLLAGMWEMAVGNTFGATSLSSYGGFWIAYGILLTPSWGITDSDGPYAGDVHSVIGFFLAGWFVFTTLLLLCTLRSTAAFVFLFFTLDLAFLFLMCESYALDMGRTSLAGNLQRVGGFFGFLAAFAAWYNALAEMQDNSNSFFTVPVFHLPWSDKGRAMRIGRASRPMD